MISVYQAEKELNTASEMNPGAWIDHSRMAAKNARLIAQNVPGMDAEKAYIIGLLHDIGRRNGVSGIKHIFDGYYHMKSLGQDIIARACLVHSFPVKNIDCYFGQIDVDEREIKFLEKYLNNIEYNDYDRLIQLVDALSLPNGACIIEKRLVDVAIRHGVSGNKGIENKWREYLLIKKRFDELCNKDIYTLLPNVVENSFRSIV